MEFSLGGAGTLEQIKRLPLPDYSRIARQRLVLSNLALRPGDTGLLSSLRWRYRLRAPIARCRCGGQRTRAAVGERPAGSGKR